MKFSSAAEEFFQKGCSALDGGLLHLAKACFEFARKEDKSPLLDSYLALCIAKTGGDCEQALRMIRDVIASDPANQVHYLHLGRILLSSGDRVAALAAFRQGLSMGPSSEIEDEISKLGNRKPALFPSLPRRHPLNKYGGLALKAIGLR